MKTRTKTIKIDDLDISVNHKTRQVTLKLPIGSKANAKLSETVLNHTVFNIRTEDNSFALKNLVVNEQPLTTFGRDVEHRTWGLLVILKGDTFSE